MKNRTVLAWCFLILLSGLGHWRAGGTNPESRFALLAALSEKHSFEITSYRDRTVDWAKTPDGKYFSNKAPGPALLSFPLYWVLDQVRVHIQNPINEEFEGQSRRVSPPTQMKSLISFLTQVLPFTLLAFLLLSDLQKSRRSQSAIVFCACALGFGQTASLFLPVFFGHGFAAWTTLGTLWSLLRKRFGWLGVFLGIHLLSDYGAFYMLPAVFVWVFTEQRKSLRWLKDFAWGVLPFALLWTWYHTICFGSPWSLPFAFQNPRFVEAAVQTTTGPVWGVVRFFPSLTTLNEILFGTTRGLLFTQPWILFLFFQLPWIWFQIKERETKLYSTLGFLSLCGLLWMNAAFNGWHGGSCPGPRYLSAALPIFAMVGACLYDSYSKKMRTGLWILLFPSLVLSGLVLARGLEAPEGISVWTYYLTPPEPGKAFGLFRNLFFYFGLLGATLWVTLRKKSY